MTNHHPYYEKSNHFADCQAALEAANPSYLEGQPRHGVRIDAQGHVENYTIEGS